MIAMAMTVGMLVLGAVGGSWAWQTRVQKGKGTDWKGIDLRLVGGAILTLFGLALAGPFGLIAAGLGVGSLAHWGASKANEGGLFGGGGQRAIPAGAQHKIPRR